MCPRRKLAGASAVAAVCVLATAGFGQDEETSPPIGFAPASRAAHKKAEAHALTVPTPDNARSWLRTVTEEPHVAGTEADHKTALFVRDKLREWGWKTEIAEYEVLLNYPRTRFGKDEEVTPRLELYEPSGRRLPLTEAPIASDKDSASPDAFPAFNGYGVSGDVRGQVVYANYARPEDFKALEKMGVDVKGKIVLARYGELFRGLKVRNAQQRGAKGILIYSDPADDGYDKGDVYPEGPYRPGSAIQRGSVQFLSLGPGDPSTPYGPSVRGAKRLPFDTRNGFVLPPDDRLRKFSESLFKGEEKIVRDWERETGLTRIDYFATIPSLPISYDAARPIIKALGGANVPAGWQGGLPFAYHVGPGPAEVHFSTSMDYQVRTIWNVIATIEGSAEPDRWVMVGNHRDAWVYGAVDPGSGTAATLEMCRAIGSAVKHGWKPRRTLVYASWDGEEYGLVGSTEWAEDHARELGEKAVLMLNVDSAVGGPDLDLGGVPALRDLALDAAGAVREVRSGKPLREVWTERRRSAWANQGPIELFDPVWDPVPDHPAGSNGTTHSPHTPRFSPQMNWLGSGSDYTAFVDHLGVPAVDAGFHGRYGVYHSIYDDFTWMEKFGDPEFVTHATAARLYTALAMRAAGAEVVPLKFVPYGEALREHVDDLRRTVERKARAAGPDAAKPPITFEGLPRLVAAVRAFQSQAAALDHATDALARRDAVPAKHLARVNDALAKVERAFLLPKGLPGRPWFKHAVYAPGLTTGYASWPLPGVRQAVQDDDPALLAAQVPALIDRLNAATSAMKAAAEEASGEN
jgi:N-acetylated-alpha-linked acidic dipeptidase